MTTIEPLGHIEPPAHTGKRGKPVAPEGAAMLALAPGEALAFRECSNPEFLRRGIAQLARRHGIKIRTWMDSGVLHVYRELEATS